MYIYSFYLFVNGIRFVPKRSHNLVFATFCFVGLQFQNASSGRHFPF